MTLDEIRELIQLVSETGVAELEVQRGENRVRIRRSFGTDVFEGTVAAQSSAAKAAVAAAASAPAPGKPESQPEAPGEKELVTVKSPIVGTFYECAAPGTPPFVRVGETVQPGKVLCIIESMKLMNEIEAEIAGVVVSKLVPNGQPVEYGEALFAIRPV
ncbi:MAG: biotin carboxyl carrier protein [Bryobacterales bacterium]|nr:biotin carboxyl carrier protein [Bryobacterales bacterium]